MSIKVCKFGGTSMADGNIMKRAAKSCRRTKPVGTWWFPRPENGSAEILK